MKLLVTGGCGFIGSNFINNYFSQCTLLVNVDALNYCANENYVNILIRTNPNYYLINSNIQNKAKMLEIYENFNITHVVHFAAQ